MEIILGGILLALFVVFIIWGMSGSKKGWG